MPITREQFAELVAQRLKEGGYIDVRIGSSDARWLEIAHRAVDAVRWAENEILVLPAPDGG